MIKSVVRSKVILELKIAPFSVVAEATGSDACKSCIFLDHSPNLRETSKMLLLFLLHQGMQL